MPTRRHPFLPAVLLASSLLTTPALAGDIRWINPAGGPYASLGNWLGNFPPGAADIADFGVATSGSGPAYPITFGIGAFTAAGLVVHRDSPTFALNGGTYTLTGAGLPDAITLAPAIGESAS